MPPMRPATFAIMQAIYVISDATTTACSDQAAASALPSPPCAFSPSPAAAPALAWASTSTSTCA
eukprot:CAMPEP_0174748990 /NCGR_PEP_ID=MMETSP1094-20130205/94739_1 /TAXON_ID=156173 /ORGANISM="Chrysochromulina brevifilum, Strain UTEX LB 985" /LENGTH=63 /DNA_ID=CAMNT_0015954129 /DNA_START=198 /DNA_END=387 /DNA_ORIENTATION=-